MTDEKNNEEYERIRKNAIEIKKELDELINLQSDGFYANDLRTTEKIGERVRILQSYANKYPQLDYLLDNLPFMYAVGEKCRRQDVLNKKLKNSDAVVQARKELGEQAIQVSDYRYQDQHVQQYIQHDNSRWSKFKAKLKEIL